MILAEVIVGIGYIDKMFRSGVAVDGEGVFVVSSGVFGVFLYFPAIGAFLETFGDVLLGGGEFGGLGFLLFGGSAFHITTIIIYSAAIMILG